MAATTLSRAAFLLERGDGVLEVEEHHVGAEARGLAEHLLARAGHGEAGTAREVSGCVRTCTGG